MPDTFLCNKCGAPTLGPDPTGGLEDLCPRCVLGFAMDGEPPAGPPVADPPGLKAGSTLGSYEVLGLLGKGGMGVVYKARHTKLGRMVALKVLSPDFANDAEFLSRFNREAKALASLSHPNIVSVHDAGIEAGLPFLAMEFIDGVSLRKLLGERTLPPEEALQIVPQLCDALEYAHQHGVVHRDIKPENILIDKTGAVKIADFGLAKVVRGHETRADRLTKTNVVMGTPHYMAPEQVENPMSVDHRADIYSMGVVFYEMLTGELPIGRFHPPSRKARTGSRLDQIVMKSLEKAPDERYQRASHVKTDLGRMNGPMAAMAGLPGRLPAAEHTPLPVLATLSVVISSVLVIVMAGQHRTSSDTMVVVAGAGLLFGLLCTGLRTWIEPTTAHGPVRSYSVLAVVMSGVVAIVLMGTHGWGEPAAMVAGLGLVSAVVAAIFQTWRMRETGQAPVPQPASIRRIAERMVGIVLVLLGIWMIRGGGLFATAGGVAAILGGASVVWKSSTGDKVVVKVDDRVVYPPSGLAPSLAPAPAAAPAAPAAPVTVAPPPPAPARLSLMAAAGCLFSILAWVALGVGLAQVL